MIFLDYLTFAPVLLGWIAGVPDQLCPETECLACTHEPWSLAAGAGESDQLYPENQYYLTTHAHYQLLGFEEG